MKPRTEDGRRSGWGFLLAFVVFAAGVIASGVLVYRNHERAYRAEVEHQLSAIADLKVRELARWRRERLGNGNIFFRNDAFSAVVRRCLEAPEDADARRELHSWVHGILQSGHYDHARLLDPQGATLFSIPPDLPPVSDAVSNRVSEVLNSDLVTLLDFYRDNQDQRPYLAVMVPVLDPRPGARPLGVLVLRVDPEKYLYPFIKRWPTPRLTAETLLVRKEGGDVVFLNELRFQTNTALRLRIPLDRPLLPAALAALGREGVIDGMDYRGVLVVAALRTVSDSPWSLVARIDATEVYAPLRARLWTTIVMVALLLFGTGAGTGLAWHRQRVRFYREQYELAEAFRASDLRYRRLFESAKDGILILDAETGAIMDVNPYLIELLGYSRETFLGKKVWELGFFKDIVANEEKFVELQSQEYVRYEDLPLETADGRRIDVEFVSNVYLVSRHKVIQCNIRDITDRVRAAAALKQSSQELQEKNVELERFLYTASHDLKSPVVTIRTFLDYLEQDIAAAQAGRIEKDMTFLRAAGDKMARLLDELLNLSRIGRIVSPPVRVPLRALVDEALAAAAGSIAARGVQTKVDDRDVTLQGDRLRLANIWQNLVENAVKFMGEQTSPCIEIGVEPRDAEMVFFVRDNGIGIDPRYHAKVFGLFEKLDPKAAGTGIGLAIVKRIVELYGGRIWLESEGVGKGTCFYFTLPKAIDNPKERERA